MVTAHTLSDASYLALQMQSVVRKEALYVQCRSRDWFGVGLLNSIWEQHAKLQEWSQVCLACAKERRHWRCVQVREGVSLQKTVASHRMWPAHLPWTCVPRDPRYCRMRSLCKERS
jgi:hypothetical protein